MIAPPQPITICLVEDDVELSESVARYVDGTPGFRCLGAYASGEVALAEIPRQQPAGVLMDINLPGMSGIECVAQLRGTMPALLVFMLTAYTKLHVHSRIEAVVKTMGRRDHPQAPRPRTGR